MVGTTGGAGSIGGGVAADFNRPRLGGNAGGSPGLNLPPLKSSRVSWLLERKCQSSNCSYLIDVSHEQIGSVLRSLQSEENYELTKLATVHKYCLLLRNKRLLLRRSSCLVFHRFVTALTGLNSIRVLLKRYNVLHKRTGFDFFLIHLRLVN